MFWNYRVDSFLIFSSQEASPQKGAKIMFFLSNCGMKSLKFSTTTVWFSNSLVALNKSFKTLRCNTSEVNLLVEQRFLNSFKQLFNILRCRSLKFCKLFARISANCNIFSLFNVSRSNFQSKRNTFQFPMIKFPSWTIIVTIIPFEKTKYYG